MMEITGGIANGLKLLELAEDTGIRPTLVRARRSFFDKLGSIQGSVFADCFAGSGIMGLEAASRGAGVVYSAEESNIALLQIKKNIHRIQRTGVTAEFIPLQGSLPASLVRHRPSYQPDIVFADPPYQQSMNLLEEMTSSPFFTQWCGKATLYWELPDFEIELHPPKTPWMLLDIMHSGAASFLVMQVRK